MKEKIVKNNKLLLLVLGSMVLLGIIILSNFISFGNMEKIMLEQLIENQITQTKFVSSQIESHITQVRDEILTLSQFPVMNNLNISHCSGDMKVIHEDIESKIDSLLRANKEGTIIESSSPGYENFLNLNIQNKDYFIEPKTTNKVYISELVKQGSNQQLFISVPLFDTTEYTPYPNFEGEFKGVLLSIIELDNLYNLYLHPIIDSGVNFFVLLDVDSNEIILQSEDLAPFKSPFSLISLTDQKNAIIDIDTLGETIMTSSDLFLGSDHWKLVILTPVDNIKQEVQSVQQRHLFSLIFVILVITIVLVALFLIYKSKDTIEHELKKANLTLEKLGISVSTEEDKFNQADLVLDSHNVYLIKEDDENQAHELFISSLNRGFSGLGLIRENPDNFRKKYNLNKTSFIWLTKNKIDGCPCETDIPALNKIIAEFIIKSDKSVILIDRFDYLIRTNSFDQVIKALHELKDLVSQQDAIIIISLNPEIINPARLKEIEAETVDLYGKFLKRTVNLSEMEYNILHFINEKNIVNKLVSYKDITQYFKITKPTTRTKIKQLYVLGLVQIDQKGRFKSLKVTSAGRKILK